MSVDGKHFSCEKEENSSSPHFLSQLKGIINKPNENIKEEEQINNKDITESLENNCEQKEEKTNKSFYSNGANNNNLNDEINIENNDKNNQNEKNNQDNLDNTNKKDIDIGNKKKEEKRNEQIIKNNEKENNSDKNNNIDIINQNKDIKIQKNENNKNLEEEKKNNENNEDDLDRKDSNESKKSNKSQKEGKHKLCPSCLNNCFKWELKAEIKGKRAFPKNFKSKFNFLGESAFFKKLDFSILNALHNSLSMTKWNISANNLQQIDTRETLENIKTESINRLNNLSSNKIPSSPIKDNTSSSVRELLNINYPIDNTKFNYSIIDANLCIKDNLKNLFLLVFDLDQIENIIEDINNESKDNKDNKEISKEDVNKSQNNKDIRTIDDDCVEREIYFVLNGTFHGNKIFKNDLNFSVEYREFIKSAQFRLQNYQNKIIEMSKKIKGKKNIFQNMQTNFFGKVLTNINLGIEFSKPQSHEIIQTNFNSIVNSHIQLNKILIELTIPNTFINNNKLNISNIFEGGNEDSNSISTKKTEISSPKKEENNNNMNNNQNNNPTNKNTYNIMFNSNISSPNTRTIGINRSIPASPHLNDFQKLIYQQKYSPLINNNIRNNNINMNNNFQNRAQNSFYSATPNYPSSPLMGINPQQIFCSPQPNTYSPLSASLMMMQMPFMGRMMQQPMSITSPYNSNYSSPYMGNGNRNNNSGLNSSNQLRKCSDCVQEKILIENPMNTIGRKIYNSNHQTPIMLKRNDEEPISRINLNQYMSPKSMGPSSSFTLGNNMSTSFNLNNPKYNGTVYQLNPMNNINQMNQMGNINQIGQGIPMTIRQKIVETTKKEEVERINKTLNAMNRVRPNANNNMPNMNNIPNINNINNFNNSNVNNIRNNNMIKNNNINNINNIVSMNSFNTINNMKNISKFVLF